MAIKSLLIANRGEIAIRIARSAGAWGIRTVAVYSADENQALHVRRTDHAIELPGSGPQAYLDGAQLVEAALRTNCDAVHPGYGFLSESAAFARRCRDADLTFVGPRTDLLELFGDKTRSRSLAQSCGVPVMRGTFTASSVQDIRLFWEQLGSDTAIVIKASAGGGGRGMRVVSRLEDLPEAYVRCQSEALKAFGCGDLYVEEYLTRARHVEVQIIGDAAGNVTQLGERECTLQRRHQKLVELAPAAWLSEGLRTRLQAAALRLAREVRYDSLGTFEFLVNADTHGDDARFVFIEANARLQVEHTVTEEVLGVDLVETQLRVAGGEDLAQLGLLQHQVPVPKGLAMQLRVNMETIQADGTVKPSSGLLRTFDPPSGRGIRVDTFGYAGYQTTSNFDSLLAKVIVHSARSSLPAAATAAYRALCEFRIDGVATNIGFLQNLLRHAEFLEDCVDTRFIEKHAAELTNTTDHPKRYADSGGAAGPSGHSPSSITDAPGALRAPLQGTLISIDVREGDTVTKSQQLLVIESMKMEHVVAAPFSGRVSRIISKIGDTVTEGAPLVIIEEAHVTQTTSTKDADVDPNYVRPDLAEVLERHRRTLDDARPDAVAKRRSKHQRTARENVADLCDPGTFLEYGALALAAQQARRPLEELIAKSPADGMITGIGRINGSLFPERAARAVVMAYDYTVFAGTQGARNHIKTDRMLQVAQSEGLPIVLFAEGGGGRPGDTETSGDAGGTPTFGRFAELSGQVPLVGIASGRCFAGNASLLGCCDVIIATANTNIGMGGPAMVEGGGLGVVAAEEIGPLQVQVANGVIDLAVADEAEAVQVAKRYLSYFQGPVAEFTAADQRLLRQAIPENRLRAYDVRTIIETLSDVGWVLELRRDFARGMITCLTRVEGRPIGIIANNPAFLGGAIDSDGADKASRFMQLCDAYDLPLLFLCDTPGIMVGPEIERTALVRHSSRMFITGANLTVPFFTVVLRKAYGLGAIAMSGGSFKRSVSSVAWPTGEFGGMGLEGAVKLAYRNELAQIQDPQQRKARYDAMVAQLYQRGKALSIASIFGIDDTIDPADTRQWLATLLRTVRAPAARTGKKRPAVDSW
jgi:acetyl/propionyl-CoA carboxylase alpha subunit